MINCWAKTDECGAPALTVAQHCVDVGQVALALIEAMAPAQSKLLPNGAAALAALHDIGKLTVGFQLKSPKWGSSALRSSLAKIGAQDSLSNHALMSERFLEDRTKRIWAHAVGGHHGRFQISCEDVETHLIEEFEAARNELCQTLVDQFGGLPDGKLCSQSKLTLKSFVTGFIILADWIGSNEEFFALPPASEFGLGKGPDFEKAATNAEKAIQAIGWATGKLRPGLEFGELFRNERTGEPFGEKILQKRAVEKIRRPGLYVIEAAMGEGKTEAALWAAYKLITNGHAAGIYFALPTQLTSNKIHERVARFLQNSTEDGTDLALAHAASWLVDSNKMHIRPSVLSDEDAEQHSRAARTWFTSRKALLSRFGVGTIDQALMATLPVRFSMLRMFGLGGKVVIFDEVHSYDAYTGTILDSLIQHLIHLQCTVIILSATLTAQRRQEFEGMGAQLVEGPVDEAKPKNVEVRPISLQSEILDPEIASEIDDAAAAGACVLVIRNTVALAQETYRMLNGSKREDSYEVGLLHSRLPFVIRNGDEHGNGGREDYWVNQLGRDESLRPKKGCILVSTQVVEQSVDIDADLLVTDLCPTDQLLQRIGRMHRHGFENFKRPQHYQTPKVWILKPQLPPNENSDSKSLERAMLPHSKIYAPYVLLRTAEVWNRTEIQLPSQIHRLLNETYSEREEAGAMSGLLEDLESRRSKLASRGKTMAGGGRATGTDDELHAPTRWGDLPTIQLTLLAKEPYTEDSGLLFLSEPETAFSFREGTTWSCQLAVAIFRSSCRIPRYHLDEVPLPPSWLRMHSYGEAAGVWIGTGGRLHLVGGEATNLVYTDQLGVFHRPKKPSAPEEDEALELPLGQDECPY